MPPWYVDKRIGYQRFLADQPLSDEEIATIVQLRYGLLPAATAQQEHPHRAPQQR